MDPSWVLSELQVAPPSPRWPFSTARMCQRRGCMTTGGFQPWYQYDQSLIEEKSWVWTDVNSFLISQAMMLDDVRCLLEWNWRFRQGSSGDRPCFLENRAQEVPRSVGCQRFAGNSHIPEPAVAWMVGCWCSKNVWKRENYAHVIASWISNMMINTMGFYRIFLVTGSLFSDTRYPVLRWRLMANGHDHDVARDLIDSFRSI